MRRFISLLIFLPVAILAAVFAVSNRTPIELDLWPVPERLNAPLYLVVLGAAGLGLIVGALAAWMGAGKWRRLARDRQRRLVSLEKRLPETDAEQP